MSGPADQPPVRVVPLLLAILTLGFVYYLWPLTLDIPLLDPDEGFHAAIAQEMADRGDWITPRFLGVAFFDKPVLFFWAEAASLRVLGANEAAVRAPGLILGLLGTLTTGLLTATVVGGRAGAVASLLYATMLLPSALNQSAVHDVALVPWTNLALLFLWRARNARGVLSNALIAGLWVGLAVLTKGLIGVALVGLAFGGFVLWSRRAFWQSALILAIALLVGAVIAAPWYVEMNRLHPGYAQYYFIERHLKGYATSTQLHSDRPWWYYGPILLGGALPWVTALWWARPRASSSHDTGPRDGVYLMWIWLTTSVFFLSAAGAKLLTYVLPAFPAIAALSAVAWTARMDGHGSAAGRGGLRVSTAVVGSLMLPVCLFAVMHRFDLAHPVWIWIAGISISVAWFLIVVPARSGDRSMRELGTGLALMTLTFVFVMRVLLPPVAVGLSARDLAQHFNREGKLPAQLLFLDERLGSFVFYLEPELRRALTPERVANVGVNELQDPKWSNEAVVAVSETRYARVAGRLSLAGPPAARAGHYRLYRLQDLRGP